MGISKTFVIIPNWNGVDLIAECLESLKKQTIPVTVVVVDNGSKDNSVKLIKDRFPSVKLIELPENTGFGGGVNTGFQYALEQGAEHLIALNNDAVADPSWAERLVSTAEAHTDLGIVTCKFMRLDRIHLDSTGEEYSTRGLPFPRGRNEKDVGQYDKKVDIFAATGGASLYKAELLRKVGMFDEDFFAYFEDVDLSFRAQLAGWKVRYEPNAIAYHHVSATSSRMGNFARFHSAKNFLLVYAKNMPTKLYLKYLPLFTLQLLRMMATSIARGKFHVFIHGTWAAIKLHSKTRQKRRDIKASRVVSVEYIDSMLFHHRSQKQPAIKG